MRQTSTLHYSVSKFQFEINGSILLNNSIRLIIVFVHCQSSDFDSWRGFGNSGFADYPAYNFVKRQSGSQARRWVSFSIFNIISPESAPRPIQSLSYNVLLLSVPSARTRHCVDWRLLVKKRNAKISKLRILGCCCKVWTISWDKYISSTRQEILY